MDRNVYKVRTLQEDGGQQLSEPSARDKLLSYFPAEALALYSGLDPALRSTVNGTALKITLWCALAASSVFCWFYLVRFWHVNRPFQRLVSCGALVLYVASLGGPFRTISGFKPGYAVIAAILATAFLVFVPSPAPPPEA